MKKPLIYLAILVSFIACKKDKEEDDNGTGTGSAHVTVYNATFWSSTTPYGALSSNVTVKLYTSATNFPDNPAYSGTTSSTGEVIFENMASGEYFIVAEKDWLHEKLSNLLHFSQGVGGFTSDSLFQADPGPQETPIPLNGGAGRFRLNDLNGDGIIDFNDRQDFPAKKITVTNGKKTQEKVLIGHMYNQVFGRRSGTGINSALNTAYIKLSDWHEQQVTLDAVYTDDQSCASMTSSWCVFNTYQVASYDQVVSKFWSDGFALVSLLGNIIANTELATDMSDADKKLVTGQAKALKAYVYLQLTHYFGGLPLQEWLALHPAAPRVPQTETDAFIIALLTAAKADLEAGTPSTDRSKISAAACQALLARLYLQQKNYAKAQEYSHNIISSTNYTLGTGNNVFTQTTDQEIIWTSASKLNSLDVKKAFTKGTFLPELRYAEILLIRAEAAIEQGDAPNTLDYLNPVRTRAGLSIINSTDVPTLRTAVQTEWAREMANEGVRFPALVRWNKTTEALAPGGFQPHHRYLPIPLTLLNWYPNLVQNLGYN